MKMKVNVYSLFDKKAEVYHTPCIIESDAVALRTVRMSLRDQKSMLFQFPDDFSLVKVAEFNPDTGEVIPMHSVLISTLAGLIDEAGAAVGAASPLKSQSAPITTDKA